MNDYNDNSDYSNRVGRKLEEDIPKEDFKKEHKPKRTLEELGITEDKYYIVGKRKH